MAAVAAHVTPTHGHQVWRPGLGPTQRAASSGTPWARLAQPSWWWQPAHFRTSLCCRSFLRLTPPLQLDAFLALLHLPLLVTSLNEIQHKSVVLNSGRPVTKVPWGVYSKMALRWEYHCRIMSRSFVFILFPNSFLTLKCLWNFQLKILIPFSELSLYAKLASRLPNWKHLDGILNLGHFFFSQFVLL